MEDPINPPNPEIPPPATSKALERHNQVDITTVVEAARYLIHYGTLAAGVLSGALNPITVVAEIVKAVLDLQARAGLPQTGTLTPETLDLIGRPRCGCLDVERIGAEQARWRKNRLTYSITDYVTGLSKADTDDIIKLAWQQWADVADLGFTQVTGTSADIIISTGRGQAQGFDGPSGTLAYAYLPTGNDQQLLMRFDLDEKWIKEGGGGILLKNVACHEQGHLLGLDHSRVSSALMAPFYSPPITKPQPNDDVARIQALYGPPKTPPTPTPIPPVPGPAGTWTITLTGSGQLAPPVGANWKNN